MHPALKSLLAAAFWAMPAAAQIGQGVTIPRGKMHFPRAQGRVVVMMVEKATVVPTGS